MPHLSKDSYPCKAWWLKGELVPKGTPGAVKCPHISKVPESYKYDHVSETKRRLRRCEKCKAEWFTKEYDTTEPTLSRIYKSTPDNRPTLFPVADYLEPSDQN